MPKIAFGTRERYSVADVDQPVRLGVAVPIQNIRLQAGFHTGARSIVFNGQSGTIKVGGKDIPLYSFTPSNEEPRQ